MILRPSPKLITLVFCLAVPFPLLARDWYVSGKGDDARSGTSSSTAFRTLKKGAAELQPGDTLIVGDGVYTSSDSGDGSSVLNLSQRGRPDAWITVKAAPGAHPELRPTGWHAIFITGAYIVIDGLHVTGANDSITLIDALADGALKEKDGKPYSGSPSFNTNGISTDGRNSPVDRKPHHITVRNCTVAKCPGGGVTFLEADHFTVEDCVVYGNAWYMRYAGSGITALNDWAFDDAPGYHVVIQRNLVWDNKVLVPWSAIGKLSDGNGILLDVTDKKAGAANPTEAAAAGDPNAASLNPERPLWKYRAVIANNVSAYNGGSGIHTFRTAHVDIINNTTYCNGQIVGYPDLFANSSTDVVFLNNIVVPRPGGKVTGNYNNTNIRWDYNLYPVAQKILTGPHDLVADPLFMNVRPDLREADFRIQKGSPAHNSGTDDVAQSADITGKKRPAGKARDRGAYEQ